MEVSDQLHAPAALPPGTHWIGAWVGPRAVQDAVVERKIPSPRREWNPKTPIVQPAAQRYTDWAITAVYYRIFLMFVCMVWLWSSRNDFIARRKDSHVTW
jgi:hypothetical protein